MAAGPLTSQGISRVAIALLTRQLTLARTATAVPMEDFRGGNGDTVTIRVPQPGGHRVQAAAHDLLVADDISEVAVEVQLRHLYNLKNVSDQELTFNLTDFARQVTLPQTTGVATGADDEVAAAFNAHTATIDLESDGSDIEAAILEAREIMSRNLIPITERFLALSPEVVTFILSLDKFTRVDASGADDALRRAIIGSVYGFTALEAVGLDAGTAVAYHRSGVAFGNATPARPRGAADSATATVQGIGLRHVFQYDPTRARDQSLVSTFAGAATVADDDAGTEFPRIVKMAVDLAPDA